MEFYIGQRVMCITPKRGSLDVPEPTIGDTATVCNTFFDDELVLELIEFPAPETDEWMAGWFARNFIPIIEEKKAVTAILSKKQDVDA